ncbi:MAG TPA: hypothetical protein VLV83_21925 [Acidobacteriota bacterium]|nr:hypothetical protein [Acidobacteriota bacterium]
MKKMWWLFFLFSPLLLAAVLQAQELGFERLAVLDVGKNPHQIAFSRDGRQAYIATSGSDSVAVVNVPTLEVSGRYPVDGTPLGVAVLPGGKGLAVTRFGQGGVARYSLPDFEFVDEIETAPGPSLLVPLPEGRFLFSTEQADQVSILNGKTFEVEKVMSTGGRPFPPSATSDGKLAFVPNYDDGTVFVYDLELGEKVAEVAVGEKPSGGAVMRNDTVYGVAVRGENKLALINIAERKLTTAYDQGIGDSPFSIVPTPDGLMAFVNNTASHDISVLSIPGARTLARFGVGEIPITMAVHPSGETLWVASEGSHEVAVFKLRSLDELVEQMQSMAPQASPSSSTSQSSSGPLLIAQCRREVEELHKFFEGWANSTLENNDEAFSRFSSVLDENFHIINPSGQVISRQVLVDSLRQSYGSVPTGQARYWIEDFQGWQVAPGVFLALYEEWQNLDGKKSGGRVSSALFRRAEGTPNGVKWLHLHETYLTQR